MEETYEDVEDLIHHVTHRFMRRKGLDEYEYDEWHGESCQAFVLSCESFDPKQARFTTHLWHGIWWSLCQKQRKELYNEKGTHFDENQALKNLHRRRKWMEGIIDYRNNVDVHAFEDLLASLSEDARTVVRIVVGAGGVTDEEESEPGEIRVGLYLLLTNFGWSFRRIVETFHEIKTVLSN
jgi:hypothetical protein